MIKRKKLNNKGMTLIELLLCFIIVSVIVVSLLDTVMDYKTREQTEDIRKTVISYKNVITKKIQSDIIANDLSSCEVTKQETNSSKTKETYEIKLIFNKPFSNGSKAKILTIVRGNNENYIMYPDIVNNNYQDVRYDLETGTDVYDIDVNKTDNSKTNYSDIRFSYVLIEQKGDIFKLDIPIYHSELGSKYHITLIAPLNYQKMVDENI